MNDNKQHLLLDSVARYWQGYFSSEEAETPFLRKWSSETLARRMVERAMRLLDTSILLDSEQGTLSTEYPRDESTLRTVSHRDWRGIRLRILGIDSQEEILPPAFQQFVSEATKDCLSLCILPSSYIGAWQDFASSLREKEQFTIPVFPMDMNALARGRWSLLDLIEFKLYRICLLEKQDFESQYGEALLNEIDQSGTAAESPVLVDLSRVLKKLDEPSSEWADHPQLDNVMACVRDGRDCLLEGASSSGKTTLAFEAGLRLAASGMPVKFADVGSISPHALTRPLRNLGLQHRSRKDTLVIYDDLQSNPSAARYLLLMTRLLRKASSIGRTTVLAITWPSYAQEAAKQLPGSQRINVNPSDAQRVILAKQKKEFTNVEIAAFRSTAKNDVLLWRLLLEASREKKLTTTDLAEVIWTRRTRSYKGDSAALRRVALLASLLGQYEFEFSGDFLEYQAGVSKTMIEGMVKARVLRRVGENLTLGHRSVCILLAQWLASDEKIWDYLRRAGKPTEPLEIIHTYIRTARVSEVWAILKKLYTQAGFKGSSEISYSAQVLAQAWMALDSLMERIEQQQQVDPTWNKTLSSELFAIEALCAVGKKQTAAPSISFMRSKWSLVDGKMHVRPGTTERLDFDQIQQTMKDEDEILQFRPSGWESAEQVDLDRFHDTWEKGLVLCAEAAYQERTEQELQQLAIAVESEQEADGNFYPRRVSWSTARVLEGLARCGRNYTNSAVVKRACDWLLRSTKNGGPFQEGVWESGTGAWNTTIETTSMCVLALTLAGIPHDDPRLSAASNYLISEKTEWTKSKHEIDGAFALTAYLALGGNPQSIIPQIQYLLKLARTEAFWDSATKSSKESFDQSCLVAAITDYLIRSAWSILRNDLPELLDAFAVSPLPLPKPVVADSKPGVHEKESQPETRAIDRERKNDGAERHIENLREQTSQKIVFEYEGLVARLKDQLGQLKSYEAKLTHGRNSSTSFQELERNRAEIQGKMSTIESRHSKALKELMAATSEREITDIYSRWKNDCED